MDDALGDALVVEMDDLLAEDEVLQQDRAARAGLQRVLVVGDRDALVGRQQRCFARRLLVHLLATSQNDRGFGRGLPGLLGLLHVVLQV